MRIQYEDTLFYVSLSSSLEKHLIKQRIKKSIGYFIGKPYQKDPYLSFAESILNSLESPLVVDIGANIGTTVLPLANKFPKGRFIAVEAHPTPAARFIQNCQANQLTNVSLINAPIAPLAQLMNIYSCSNNSGGHRVTGGFEQRIDVPPLQSMKYISVMPISLQALFSYAQIACCDVLKIDVEGFEVQVLESLGELLTPSNVKVVVAEYGPEGMRQAGKTGWDMVQLMKTRGFQCIELVSQKPIVKPEDMPHLADYTVTDFVFYTE